MSPKMTRREFLKTATMSALAFGAFGALPIEKVFAAGDCTVKTRYGTFNGFLDKNGVKTWLGIPYAKPPVGKLRWQAPQPLKPSNQSFNAKKFGFSACQVVDEFEVASTKPQSEDCLTLKRKIFRSWFSFTAAAFKAAVPATRFIAERTLQRRMMSLSFLLTIV